MIQSHKLSVHSKIKVEEEEEEEEGFLGAKRKNNAWSGCESVAERETL